MTNKNPYEIRLDVLKLAKEMLEIEHRAAENVWLTKAGSPTYNGHLPAETAEAFYASAPQPPSVDDVIAKASALYNFVSDNSTLSGSNSASRTLLTENTRGLEKTRDGNGQRIYKK